MGQDECSEKPVQIIEPEIERLDPNGDVIITSSCESSQAQRRWLVSSKILILASPVFAALFQPNFIEGAQMSTSNRPHIPLHEDDPAALGVILEILHYRDPPQAMHLEPKEIASIAIHCDKYDCIAAFRPWIIYWLTHIRGPLSQEEYGYAILAAHLFRDEDRFSQLSAKAVTALTLDFHLHWEHLGMLSLLPPSFQDDLSVQIENSLSQLHYQLQFMDDFLRTDHRGYRMGVMVCMDCGRSHPPNAKKCHTCNNDELFPKYCTPEFRVAEYFAALTGAGLWPSLEPFQTCSISDLIERAMLAKSSLKHDCQGGERCALEVGLDVLINKFRDIADSVKGFPLYPLHSDSGCVE